MSALTSVRYLFTQRPCRDRGEEVVPFASDPQPFEVVRLAQAAKGVPRCAVGLEAAEQFVLGVLAASMLKNDSERAIILHD